MKAIAAGFLAFLLSVPLQSQPCIEVTREVYLMGTSATLTSCATSRESGLSQIEALLRILEEAERELSTWIPESAMSELNRSPVGNRFQLNHRLTSLFADLFRWKSKTGGAFDPGVGPLTEAWGIHGEGRRPSSEELERALSRTGIAHLDFNPTQQWIVRKSEVTIDVGAFGKGEGLDRAVEYATDHQFDPFLINLGGQIAVYGIPSGRTAWAVDIAHPQERQRSALSVDLRAGSISTSAGSERDVHLVDGERIGHHVDPRTGQTVISNVSVSVWHERALVADILSTALFVMGPKQGFAWAEAHGIAGCFLIPGSDGKIQIKATRTWKVNLHHQIRP